jgi:hypothetical protein
MQWIIQTTPHAGMVVGFIPLGLWYIISLFIGIYIPSLLLIVCKFRRWLRQLLLPYLIVHIAQIITEFIAVSILVPGFAFITGIIYTTYRIWQLQTAISLHNQSVILEERANLFLQNFLLFAAVFWMLNLVFLLSVMLK